MTQNNDYRNHRVLQHLDDVFSDQLDEMINSHAIKVGMDPDHEYWDEWYDAEWLLAFTAYMGEILPNISVTVTCNRDKDRWSITTPPPEGANFH
jgi:hypothetical protein